MNQTKVYRADLLARLLAALPPGLLAIVFLLGLLQTGSWLAAAGVMLFAVALVRPLVARVEVDDRSIREVGAFRTHELSLEDIAGYRLSPGRRGRKLVFEPRGEDMPSMRLEAHSDLVEWASQRFPDLAQQEAHAEFEGALASELLGASEDERLNAIEKARTWAVYLTAAAIVASAWVLFFPIALRLAMTIALVLPAVALVLVKRYRGALRLVGSDQSALPSVLLAILIPILALAVRSSIHWTVLSWDNFWIPFAVVAMTMYFVATQSAIPSERGPLFAFVFAIWALLYGYGSVLTLNHILDGNGLTRYEPPIVAKRTDGVRRPTRIMQLGPAGPQKQAFEIRVSRRVYEARAPGETMAIRIGHGALDIPYYEID